MKHVDDCFCADCDPKGTRIAALEAALRQVREACRSASREAVPWCGLLAIDAIAARALEGGDRG